MKLIKSIVFHSRHRANEPAIAFPGGVATYGALMKATGAAIEALRTFALEPGTAVMLDIRNPIHHVAMIYALALLGLPSASVGTTFVAEKAGFLPPILLTDRKDSRPSPNLRTIVVDERWFATDAGAMPDYARLLAMPGFGRPENIVRYVYSSGTTGHPKCVALTQECLELRLENMRVSVAWTRGNAILSMMGFSTYGGLMGPLLAHTEGTNLCFAGNLQDVVQMINLFRVSGLSLAVAQLQPFLAILGDQPPPPSLKYLAVGGSKITRSMLLEARARICNAILVGYGSTEMSWVSNAVTSSLEVAEGFSGYLYPWVEMQVVDDADKVLPPGQEGILRVRTPELAFYVDAAGRPTEMLTNGWFYPGDIGSLGRDSQVFITGRSSDVINRGGVIVAPELIEDVLRLDPRVSDVAVVGVPNANGIEEIWAAVVSDTLIDPGLIIETARPHLNEKIPDRIIQVAVIPRAEGKTSRKTLREQLLSRR